MKSAGGSEEADGACSSSAPGRTPLNRVCGRRLRQAGLVHETVRTILAWFDYWLKARRTVSSTGGRSLLHHGRERMAHRERMAACRNSVTRRNYLKSDGKANSAKGGRLLTETAPAAGKPDSYIADRKPRAERRRDIHLRKLKPAPSSARGGVARRRARLHHGPARVGHRGHRTGEARALRLVVGARHRLRRKAREVRPDGYLGKRPVRGVSREQPESLKKPVLMGKTGCTGSS